MKALRACLDLDIGSGSDMRASTAGDQNQVTMPVGL
ncbi:MAG: hypothetical protein QOE37_2305 [Microbacteriaceae bacterium]|nr:hypothetical protein [Microbacteriaceae bacterium]